PSFAAGLPAAGPTAPVVPGAAHDARVVAPGSRGVEARDPRDQPRAQQFAGADLVIGAFGRGAGAPQRSRTVAAGVRRHRRPRAAPAFVHGGLREFRQAAATESGAGAVGGVPGFIED